MPELYLGVVPAIGFHELIDLLKGNLRDRDYQAVKVIRRQYDIENRRALWKGDELDKWGNLSREELEEVEFEVNRYPELIKKYFDEEISRAKGFLADYLTFEKEWRLKSSAFRTKKDIPVEWFDKDPLKLYQALSKYRFEKVGEMKGADNFSINAILAYLVQYIIVDKSFALDDQKGLNKLRSIHDTSNC